MSNSFKSLHNLVHHNGYTNVTTSLVMSQSLGIKHKQLLAHITQLLATLDGEAHVYIQPVTLKPNQTGLSATKHYFELNYAGFVLACQGLQGGQQATGMLHITSAFEQMSEADNTTMTITDAAKAIRKFDMNASYEHACREDLMSEASYNLSALQVILNSEDVLDAGIGFGLSNFVAYTNNLLHLAECKPSIG